MKRRLTVITVFLLMVCLILPAAAFSKGLTKFNFKKIGEGGFGDSANSYSWGVEWYNNELYVGTVRHHLWSLLTGLSAELDLPVDLGDLQDLLPDPPAVTTWGDPEYAEAMRAEIWRYRGGKWERVHQSPTFQLQQDIVFPIPGSDQSFVIPAGEYPQAYGYRTLGEYKGYLYACGVGTWIPPMPSSSVIRSPKGDPGTWEDVTGLLGPQGDRTTNVRGLVEWRDRLFVAASLPGPFPGIGGAALVYSTSDPKTEGWKAVSIPGFGGPNAEIYYLSVFNDHLYASTVNFETGFEVWKTDGSPDPQNPGKYLWTRVIKNGFGDTWNQYGMTMEVFGDYLYVGTAVGAGMVRKNGEVVGSRPIEIIRVDKDDNAELIVGSTTVYDPIEGGPEPRIPLSGWPAGFGNPFNVYSWHMSAYQGCLYLGTFDMSSMIVKALADNPELFEMFISSYPAQDLRFRENMNNSLLSGRLTSSVLNMIYKVFGGGDIWKSCDGVHWSPVTLNAFNNPKNYGIRRLVPYEQQALAVGTANPFTGKPKGGCEVWLAGTLPKTKPSPPWPPRWRFPFPSYPMENGQSGVVGAPIGNE